MSPGSQLERSVLEAKERDELYTIADALGLKPGSRTKKADLVDSILQATGVETVAAEAEAETSTKRARTPRARASATRNGADGGEAGTEPPAESVLSARSEADPETDLGDRAARTDVVGGTDRSGVVAGGKSVDQGTAAANGHGSTPIDRPTDESATGHAPGRRAGQSILAPFDGHPAEGSTSEPGGADRAQADRSASIAVANQGDANHGGGQAGPSGPPSGQSAPQTKAAWEADAGNRRNRRRRGRDRSTPAGRDFQPDGVEQPYSGDLVEVAGLLELRPEGFGFLRTKGYLPGPNDVYVSVSQVRRFALRAGDHVEGACRPAGNQEKFPALLRIDKVSGLTPEEARQRPRFEDLTPLFPDEKLRLERSGDAVNTTARIIDLVCPIGKGQRGLIVSPPKAGKTTIMKHIAHAIESNSPEVHLMVLLVDERPEEVTDMRRSVKGEVVASTFDRPSDEHTHLAELALERAKRLVELGRDVVIILDGITRLARAYNLAAPATGRIMSGGVDSGALYPPKKFFGAARNIEEGGSLTILATALVETGSTMDTVIFEEFKGTGNMELRLDRRLAERRIYPAIDIPGSSTRHEELLFDRAELRLVWQLRRVLVALGSEGSGANGLELLIDRIKTTRTNVDFLADIAKTPAPVH